MFMFAEKFKIICRIRFLTCLFLASEGYAYPIKVDVKNEIRYGKILHRISKLNANDNYVKFVF